LQQLPLFAAGSTNVSPGCSAAPSAMVGCLFQARSLWAVRWVISGFVRADSAGHCCATTSNAPVGNETGQSHKGCSRAGPCLFPQTEPGFRARSPAHTCSSGGRLRNCVWAEVLCASNCLGRSLECQVQVCRESLQMRALMCVDVLMCLGGNCFGRWFLGRQCN